VSSPHYILHAYCRSRQPAEHAFWRILVPSWRVFFANASAGAPAPFAGPYSGSHTCLAALQSAVQEIPSAHSSRTLHPLLCASPSQTAATHSHSFRSSRLTQQPTSLAFTEFDQHHQQTTMHSYHFRVRMNPHCLIDSCMYDDTASTDTSATQEAAHCSDVVQFASKMLNLLAC
jgi:hypothetical protein